jgi:tRNA(Ile)-lysidine synthase TilS/MesJ
MPKKSEEELLMHRLRHKFHKTAAEYGLIEENDRILIAVSGGKDSLALLELMAARVRVLKPRFSIVAAHVVMTNIPYQSDTVYLVNFARELGVELHIVETSFDATGDTRKSPCFLCSWNRRKALFETAKKFGCNKIALGHHQDDVLVTLLMNMTFQGAFSTMPPALKMDKFDMTIIRPLCRIEERDIQRLSELHEYHKQQKNCPHEHTSNRSRMAEVLATLEALNPEARYNLWGSMTNVQADLLPPKVD